MNPVQLPHQRRLSSLYSGLGHLSGAIHEAPVGTSLHYRKMLPEWS